MAAAPRRSGSLEPQQAIGYLAGVLGILSFVWGFLSWYTNGDQGVSGYSIAGSGAGAAIGLSIAAGLLAAVGALEKQAASAVPAAMAAAAFLVTLGLLIGKSPQGESIGAGIGLILELITTIVQAVGLAYLWLVATGRMNAPQRRAASGASAAPYQGQQYGAQGQQAASAPPPGQFAPQPPPGGYAPAAPQYGSAPAGYGQQYGRPPEPPVSPSSGYGPPSSGYPPQPAEQPEPPAQWSPQQSYPGSTREPGGDPGEHGATNP
jgi:hypothetical protein